MVNKPAALYLEDARKAREFIFHDMTPSLAAPLPSPCLALPSSPALGTLRAVTFVSAAPHRTLSSLDERDTTSNSLDGQGTVMRDRPRGPTIMYGRLDSGFFFECHHSRIERGSYISLELCNQISPRPELVQAQGHHSLQYNNESYSVLGFVQFVIAVPDPQDYNKEIQMKVSATVIPNIYPDLFLGRDHTLQPH